MFFFWGAQWVHYIAWSGHRVIIWKGMVVSQLSEPFTFFNLQSWLLGLVFSPKFQHIWAVGAMVLEPKSVANGRRKNRLFRPNISNFFEVTLRHSTTSQKYRLKRKKLVHVYACRTRLKAGFCTKSVVWLSILHKGCFIIIRTLCFGLFLISL